MADRIRSKIVETEGWRAEHRAAHRWIEALACNIRLKAFREALAIVEENRDG